MENGNDRDLRQNRFGAVYSPPPPLSLIFIVAAARAKQNSNVNWFNCSIARRYRVSRGGIRVYSRANELSVTRARYTRAATLPRRVKARRTERKTNDEK